MSATLVPANGPSSTSSVHGSSLTVGGSIAGRKSRAILRDAELYDPKERLTVSSCEIV